MQKKKSLPPRKRKRVIKKIFFVSLISLVIVTLVSGVAYYIFAVKFKKPPFVSPLPMMQMVHAEQADKTFEELQNEMKKQQIDTKQITKAKDGSYVVTLQNGGKVIFSSQKDVMTQIASLQYILSHFTMEGRQFSNLDLRFDKPIIVVK